MPANYTNTETNNEEDAFLRETELLNETEKADVCGDSLQKHAPDNCPGRVTAIYELVLIKRFLAA